MTHSERKHYFLFKVFFHRSRHEGSLFFFCFSSTLCESQASGRDGGCREEVMKLFCNQKFQVSHQMKTLKPDRITYRPCTTSQEGGGRAESNPLSRLFDAKFVSVCIVLSLSPSRFEATVNTGVSACTPEAALPPRHAPGRRDAGTTPTKFSFCFTAAVFAHHLSAPPTSTAHT